MPEKAPIGVLASSLSSAFVKSALSGIEGALAGSGHSMKLLEVEIDDPNHANRLIEQMANENLVSALMYVHMPLNMRQIQLFRDARIPVAYLAGRVDGIDWCMVDEVKGAYDATQHLLELGHTRIALVSGPLVTLESRLREDGFLRALKERGIEFGRERDIKILNFTEGEGYDAVKWLMKLHEHPTAIFVSAGDLTALGVMSALKDMGRRVPEDVSVVGFDDLEFAATLEPPLTTVRQPLANMGALLARRLVHALDHPAAHEPGGDLVDAELIVRKSTAAPGAGA